MSVRLVDPMDWEPIKEQIDSDFGENVLQRLVGDLAPVSIPRGNTVSFYLVPTGWIEYLQRGFGDFTPSSMGIWLGDMSNNRFRVSIAVIERLARLTDRELVVSRRGAESFTYGKSILRESVVHLTPGLKRGQRVIVKNEHGDCLGLAALSVDEARLERLGPEKLVAKNLVDIGWFIRRLG